MTFTIITITYNSVSSLSDTIESVISQAGVDFEYLIVDGASTDGTVELIKEYAARDARIRWISEPDEGISDAFNKGLAMATGNWIGIINSDDMYPPGALSDVAAAIAENHEADIIYGDMLRLDEGGKPLFVLKPAPLKTMWWRMALNHPATFVSRAAYDRVGKFDKTLKIAMDYDLVLRLYTSGARFVYLDRVLAQMSYGGVSDNRLLAGQLELRKVSVREGYPKWKAAGWLLVRLVEGMIKRVLRRFGLQHLQLLHPRFKGSSKQ